MSGTSIKANALAFPEGVEQAIGSGVVTINTGKNILASETGTSDTVTRFTPDFTNLAATATTYEVIALIIAKTGHTIILQHGAYIDLPDDTDVTLTDDAYIWVIIDSSGVTHVPKAIVSTTSVTASMVGMDTLGTPTYTTIQDWSNTTQSAGVISGGALSDNGDGTVTAAAGTGIIKTTDSNVGANLFFDWAEDTSVSLTDNSDNWVYADYNAGTPIIDAVASYTSLDLHTQIIIGKVYREGTELHIIQVQQILSDFERIVIQRAWEKDAVTRVSGLSLSATGTRNFAVSAGVLYAALDRIALTAKDTSVADTFTYYYRDGGGGWTEVDAQTQINNTNYDDGSGVLATLTAGRYCNHWVYVAHDGDLYVQYGQGDYTLAQAQAALVPTPPPELTAIATLAGKIIIQKSASSFTEVTSAFTQKFEGTTVSDHGALAGLADDDHTQYVLKTGRSGGQTVIGGTGAGDDLTLQTTSNVSKGSYILSELTTDGPVIATGSGGVLATEATLAHERGGLEADVSAYAGYPKISGGTTSEVTTIPIADGGTGQTAKTAAFDALSPVTTQGDIIYRDASNNVRLAIGTATQVLTVNAGATAPEWADASGGSGLYASIAILHDQKSTGTAGGGASAATWNARDLNTEVSDPDSIVSISSNQFTPIAGTYDIHVECACAAVNGSRLRIYNVTGAAVVGVPDLNGFASATSTQGLTISLDQLFTANGTDAYRIDHYTVAAKATSGLGGAVNDGAAEVYTRVVLRKLA